MWTAIEIIVFLAAVGWDIASLVFALRRNVIGSGPSGVPVLSWLIYQVLVDWRKQTFFFTSSDQAGVALTAFHLLCHFGIPWLHRLFTRKTARPPEK
jgi:hypothetical protein